MMLVSKTFSDSQFKKLSMFKSYSKLIQEINFTDSLTNSRYVIVELVNN